MQATTGTQLNYQEAYTEKAERILREAKIPSNKIRNLVEDPDSDPETARKLEDYGLMIELYHKTSLSKPKTSPELGIGSQWARQTPLYREAVKQVLEAK